MFAARRITRLNARSSLSVLCTSAMFSKPVRPSRVSFSYMCMTMSLSSAWIAASPPALAEDFQHLPDIAELDHAALARGVMSVVNILTVAWPACTASISWSGTDGSSLPCTMTWKP